ncbi:MAG TPA: endoglucanase, partial [Pseudomonas sp.]|nr:endoglucanase [Pseudomonas sp.]
MKSLSLRHFVRAARLGLVAMLAASQLAAASDEQPGIDLIGVNLSGAGFAPHVVPGKVGQHYFYPEK